MADQLNIPPGMSLDEYDFELPEAQIAAWPAAERGRDRLLVLDRANGTLQHLGFSDIVSLLREGDVLVMNDVRVRKARLAATKEPGGGRVEILLLGERDQSGCVWECLLHSARAMRVGQVLQVQGGPRAVVTGREEERAILEFATPLTNAVLEAIGDIPLPPYIMRQREGLGTGEVPEGERVRPEKARRSPRRGMPDGEGLVTGEVPEGESVRPEKARRSPRRGMPDGEGTAPLDSERYQTVYADRALAVAAPTAGLHFTDEILQAVRARGVMTEFITLEVGWGTFAPVRVDDIRQHRMHSERFEIAEVVAQRLMQAKAEGRRIIAVGTTVVRALESAARLEGGSPVIEAGIRSTDIFITPGYAFKAIDGMITNFHTPKSTLLVLVSAFAGREAIRSAYQTAVREGYRFFSYGDAMLIL